MSENSNQELQLQVNEAYLLQKEKELVKRDKEISEENLMLV
jgi:hypothetical protein